MKNFWPKIFSLLPSLSAALSALAFMRISSEILSGEDFGKLMLLMGIVALLEAIVSSSIGQIVFYGMNKGGAADEINKLIIIFSNNIYKLILRIAVILTLVLLIAIIANKYFGWIFFVVALVPCYVVVDALRSTVISWVHASGKLSANGIFVSAESVIGIVICATIIIITDDFKYYFLGILIAKLFGLVIALINTNASTILINDSKFDGVYKNIVALTKKVDKHQLVVLPLMGLVGWLCGFLDRYAIAFSVGPVAAGHFAAATGIASRPYNILSSGLTNYFRPVLYRNLFDKSNICKSPLTIWILVSLGGGAVGYLATKYFGVMLAGIFLSKDLANSVAPILPPLCIAMGIYVATHGLDNVCLAQGKSKWLLKVQLIGSIIFAAIISFVYIMKLGVDGMVDAKIAFECIKFILSGSVVLGVLRK